MDETSVLKPHGMKVEESDDWPLFELEDAKVFGPGDGSLQDLLLAGTRNQRMVAQGILNLPDEANAGSFKASYNEGAAVTVAEVYMRSYGITDDDEVQIWAAGKSGWFEILPSRAYEPIYNKMVEAIKLYFYFLDQLQSLTRQQARRQPGLMDLLAKYARQKKQAPEAINKILKGNEAFFLHEIDKVKPDYEWPPTLLYKQIKKFYSHTHHRKPDLPRIQELKTGKRDPSRSSSSDSSRVKRKREAERPSVTKTPRPHAAKKLPENITPEYVSIDSSDSEAEEPRSTRRPLRPRPAKTRAPPMLDLDAYLAEQERGDEEEEEEEEEEELPAMRQRAPQTSKPQPSNPVSKSEASPTSSPEPEVKVRRLTLADTLDPELEEYQLVRLAPHKSDHEIWSCKICPYKMLGAHKPEAQHEIEEHARTHEDDMSERVLALEAEEAQLQASTKYLREAILKAALMNQPRVSTKSGSKLNPATRPGSFAPPQRIRRSGY